MHISKVAGMPTASTATSAPRPAVRSPTAGVDTIGALAALVWRRDRLGFGVLGLAPYVRYAVLTASGDGGGHVARRA